MQYALACRCQSHTSLETGRPIRVVLCLPCLGATPIAHATKRQVTSGNYAPITLQNAMRACNGTGYLPLHRSYA
jgi:hypothetical protein